MNFFVVAMCVHHDMFKLGNDWLPLGEQERKLLGEKIQEAKHGYMIIFQHCTNCAAVKGIPAN